MDLDKVFSPAAMRAGDADRERYVGHLATMMADGYLKHHEFSQRRDRALEAVTVSDLAALVRDLPRLPDLPEKSPVLVTYNFGTGKRFRPWRWGLTVAGGLAMAILLGPLWSTADHGLMNTPGDGILVLFLTAVCISTAAVLGILWGPGEKREER